MFSIGYTLHYYLSPQSPLVLTVDVIVVALMKAVVRRSRPANNVDDMTASDSLVDVYSFPSGHATRATVLSLVVMSLLKPMPLGCLFILFYVVALGWFVCRIESIVLY